MEALKGIKPIQMIAREHGIHPAQVAGWKKTMAAGAASLFGRGAGGGVEEQFEPSASARNCTPRSGSWAWMWISCGKNRDSPACGGGGSGWWTNNIPN